MNIVYFGTDVFLSSFRYLAGRHRILALYTYHNDEDYFTEYAIVRLARRLGIPVHYESITARETVRLFREEGCQLFFVAEYNRLLPIPPDLPEFRGINTHSSLLPQGRSYYPIEAAMARGLTRTGVTMHKLAPTLDSGDILLQRSVDIGPDTDSVDVYLRCAAHARRMIQVIMEDFDGHWARAVPQGPRLPYWPRPGADERTLSHRMTMAQALHIFRCFNKMTLAEIDDRLCYVSAAVPGPAPLSRTLGEALGISPSRYLYRLADGHLRLTVHPIEKEASAYEKASAQASAAD